jgi:hypothetical protein
LTQGFWSDGVLETRGGQITMNYLKGWLVIDIASCLPISYITQVPPQTPPAMFPVGAARALALRC